MNPPDVVVVAPLVAPNPNETVVGGAETLKARSPNTLDVVADDTPADLYIT